jgi:formiminoglutamase
MARINPPNLTLSATPPDDPRLGRLLGSRLEKGDVPRAIILGFPSDEGVRRNGGRVGAAEGPVAIRNALYRLTPDARSDGSDGFDDLLGWTRDLGDLEVAGDVESDQRNLGEALAPHLQRGTFAIVLGGGHETSYGHFLGYVGAGHSVEIVNWDAHADVRELKEGKAHSGSPFRQAIEDRSGRCRRYTVAGLEPHLIARAHLELVQRHGAAIWRDEVSSETIRALYRAAGAPTLVSFDLDAVTQAEAPGVSAPNAGGLSGELWLEAAYWAGRCAAVTSADVVELNPRVDRDGQTARVAALTVWRLLRGRADRV